MWFSRCATVLPGSLVVYQLGEQIVVLDLERRQLGLLAKGRSPVVALRATPGGERRRPALEEHFSARGGSSPSG
jgi:hypothetical protein